MSSAFRSLSKQGHSAASISILSYNVLLPNSMDGWWVHKMYSPRHGIPIEKTTWPYRQSQLQRDIANADCDIVWLVNLQEVCSDSFVEDFAFMKDIGYDMCEVYRRGRFRPATFWKSTRVCVTQSPIHRDRVLITSFERTQLLEVEDVSKAPEAQTFAVKYPLYVANCHLQAGPHTADRRLRQVHDGLETIRKDATKIATAQIAAFRKNHKKKGKGKKQTDLLQGSRESMDIPPPPPESVAAPSPLAIQAALALSDAELLKQSMLQVPIVVIGDTNCDPDDACAVHALLRYGEADINGKISTKADAPDEQTSKQNKPKAQVFGEFVDAYEYAYSLTNDEVPPTMICEELFGVLTLSAHEDATGDIYKLSPLAEETLRKIFESFATFSISSASGDAFATGLLESSAIDLMMSVDDVKMWLTRINGRPDRGSELRAAAKYMRVPADPNLISAESSASNHVATAAPVGEDEEGGDAGGISLPENGFLTLEGFCSIYGDMVYEGKVWAISYDFAFCGFPLPQSTRVFTARYDRAYVGGSEALRVISVRELGVGPIELGCVGVGGCLPNMDHPSDHLPIAIVVDYVN